MKKCKTLDEIYFPKSCNGPVFQLNGNKYPKPHRISWLPVLTEPKWHNISAAPHQGMLLRDMYTYSQSFRPMADCCSLLLEGSFHYLSRTARIWPPTAHQLIAYRDSFGGNVRQVYSNTRKGLLDWQYKR